MVLGLGGLLLDAAQQGGALFQSELQLPLVHIETKIFTSPIRQFQTDRT